MPINDLLSFPIDQKQIYRCYMHTSSQSIPNATGTGVVFVNRPEDPFNMSTFVFGQANTYVKITKPGLYRVDCAIEYNAAAGNNRIVYIYLYRNNVFTILSQQSKEGEASSAIALNASAVVTLQQGDYLLVSAHQDSGGSLGLTGTTGNYFIVSELK